MDCASENWFLIPILTTEQAFFICFHWDCGMFEVNENIANGLAVHSGNWTALVLDSLGWTKICPLVLTMVTNLASD